MKPTTKTPRSAEVTPRAKVRAAAETPAAPPAAKAKTRPLAGKAVAAPVPGRKAAEAAAAPAPASRVPPPSKGELRAQIEKLEAANASLKAKGRETNREAKAASRRIAELEAQVARLQDDAAQVVDPAIATEKLEAANAALRAKGRESSRAATLAQRRIAELEAQVEQLQTEAAEPAAPTPTPTPEAEVKAVRRGRPPGRKKAVDTADAVPPNAAAEAPEPTDLEADATRDGLDEHPSGETDQDER